MEAEWENDSISRVIERLYSAKSRIDLGDNIGYRKVVALALQDASANISGHGKDAIPELVRLFERMYGD